MEYETGDNLQNVEALPLGRINTQIVAEVVMWIFCEIFDTVKAGVSRHFYRRNILNIL